VTPTSPVGTDHCATQVPDPSTIRPLPVLAKTLELLKTKWREEGNYGYICDQFKSMRQDLTVSTLLRRVQHSADATHQVQRIKNDFTCTVYEIHARIALEKVSRPRDYSASQLPPDAVSPPRVILENSTNVRVSYENCTSEDCRVMSRNSSDIAYCTSSTHGTELVGIVVRS
jgi:hypothetical protein